MEIDRILNLWDEPKAEQNSATYAGDSEKSKQMFIAPEQNEWLYDKIAMACIMTNANKFRFAITGFQEPLRILNYTPGNMVDWHSDYGPGKHSNRKIVMTVQLSDPAAYTGCDLEVVQAEIPDAGILREKGIAIIIPSYVGHRVTPLLSGKRKALIATIAGPPFI